MKPEDDVPKQARRLQARIQRLRSPRQMPAEETPKLPITGIGLARLGVEMVAGVLVGLGLGIGADRWLNISPWGLLMGFCLGSFAGLWNIRRFWNTSFHGKK